ncbi:MAG: DUF4126 family protein [Pyrinomonadaceae bacterium]
MKQEINDSDFDIYVKAASLGAVAGLRAMTAPALLSYFASRGKNNRLKNNLLASPKISVVCALLAAGELVGDKLPFTPNRMELPGLTARIVSGAFVGGSICAARKKSVWTGAVVGAVSAVAAAYAGQNIRRIISEESGVPSAAIGAVEDAIAIGVGINALKNNE